jgi:hypothetical protein
MGNEYNGLTNRHSVYRTDSGPQVYGGWKRKNATMKGDQLPMNPFKYLTNVLTGRYAHWNSTNNAVFSEIWQHWDKVEDTAAPYLKQFGTSALNTLEKIIGPNSKTRLDKGLIDVKSLTQEDFYKAYLLLFWYFTLLLPSTHEGVKASCKKGIVALFGNKDNFEKLLQQDLDRSELPKALSHRAAGYLLTILKHGTKGMASHPVFTYSFTVLGLANYKASMENLLHQDRNSEEEEGQEIDYKAALVDDMVFNLDYRSRYAPILLEFLSESAIAEIFLFRAWATQFGYRMFSTNAEVSENLVGETVNSCKYLGLDSFAQIHGFSIEDKLGDDFISLVDDRWRDYDLVVSTDVKQTGIPTEQIIRVLSKKLHIARSDITDALSTDFLSQLDLIKKRALQLGILKISRGEPR